jgi:predicted GIY-YIG superfamily endonuclease
MGYVRSTRNDRPWELIALEEVKTINEARWIENGLKRSRGKRIKWLEQKKLAQ